MNRAELQWSAKERLREARHCCEAVHPGLLPGGICRGVRAGKSCIINFLMTSDQFPERKFSEQCWTHDIERLRGWRG